MRRSARPVLVVLALLTVACSNDSSKPSTAASGSTSSASTTSSAGPDQLEAQVASFDLAAGSPGRFLVGVFNQDKGELGYGTVALRFKYLDGDGKDQQGPTVDAATFLPVPGSAPAQAPAGPAFLQPSQGRGVYQAQVGFDRPGSWEVAITADIAGVGPRSATTAFNVLPAHLVPAVGEAAPLSDTPIAGATSLPAAAIDSRATSNQPIPDPELHQTTIPAAVAAQRPVLAVFATPVFCVSRFCGPVTDLGQNLSRTYGDRATFIHVEICKDYQAEELNDVIGDWLLRNGADGNEPWVFFIGADGKIGARWDNVASPTEMEAILRALPVIGPG